MRVQQMTSFDQLVNEFIYLAVGAGLLAVGVLTLGVGLVRPPAQRS